MTSMQIETFDRNLCRKLTASPNYGQLKIWLPK